ncbi:MAG: IS1182 family transposase [Saprospiraceae bacterium]|nr:IS1182 family transposase [Saprospiraceae bacterium]
MQGRKDIQPKMMYQVSLEELVSADNFYRQLDKAIDLRFLYKATAAHYGSEGQESIDPVVFFKICLIGYLNNINSDRKLIAYCANCLDTRLYLKYDIDEPLPWHSTISRTRSLYGEEVFIELFKKVLSLCVAKGMVRGKRQAIDSAFIKANASMDSLVEKEVLEDAEYYAEELNDNSEYKVSNTRKKLVDRHHTWKEDEYNGQPGKPNNTGHSNKLDNTDEHGNLIRPKYLSNHTHYSPTDPDARISVKPGKARQLNYFGQLAVDDGHHVITAARADHADKRDSQCLPAILSQAIYNLKEHDIIIEQIAADTAYSSGESLQFLENKNIDAYIPNFGQYRNHREGFIYNKEQDRYECQRGHKAILPFKNTSTDSKGYTKKIYRSSETVCKDCPLRSGCCGKSTKYKKLDDSIYKPLYDKMHEKLHRNMAYTKRIGRMRSSTVEPVLGTLINFLNMKRVYTRGIQNANKHVLMSALTYNLKKYIKFVTKREL